ncbi:hypothetical protein Slin15195_G031020 [Septoria linicola]|uniref:Uncharacterized protein n=1 Tax=Septoria linicola TaxID=215465 RepID=A0A9Q9APE8_9PEZI|nr:hypothetical protein Slin14017_G030040 [Septoria linicola]USW49783.1 hypothetical protein Slin15195_G031020 [Septoria linicola]
MAVISDDSPVTKDFLYAVDIPSLLFALIALPVLTTFIWQRHYNVVAKRLTVASALCLLCYSTTFVFIFVVTALAHLRLRQTPPLCTAMMMTCLILHNITKTSELAFLIERAYIISWPTKPRHRTREYVWSSVLILVPYTVVTALSLHFRIAHISNVNVCIIGPTRISLILMLCVEIGAQVYLTFRFLAPLLHVHHDGIGLMKPLRKVVIRTSIGVATTLLLNVTVKTSLTLFNGEPTWLCSLTCKVDAFLAACILHWVTMPILGDGDRAAALGIGFSSKEAIQVNDEAHAGHSRPSVTEKQLYTFQNFLNLGRSSYVEQGA